MAGDYDYHLSMNDETELDDGVHAVLLDTGSCASRAATRVIVAGSTRHADTGQLTCGGVVRPCRWRPMRGELVEPGDTPRPCGTMNGNATLISRTAVRRVGNIDPAFVQQMGDFDYGLLARAADCSIKALTPGSWAVFCRRWAGRLWPLYWLSPYVHRGASLILEHAPLRPRRATP
jgi:GT2 family glycosyltransferase